MLELIINTDQIAAIAEEKHEENDAFRIFLKNKESDIVDKLVHAINETITPKIDCTQCGKCCKTLIINITPEDTVVLANHLQLSVSNIKEKYIEESQMGQMVMNTMPCHFLKNKSCTIYEQRFTECREFPHLHRTNFTDRLFGTFMHYAMCPIIFNVVEELKIQTAFKDTVTNLP